MSVIPELSNDISVRKRRKLCELNFKEKLEIAHKVLIEHYSVADVAILHQVKPGSVRSLANKVEKDDQVLAELQLTEERKAERKAAII